MDRFKQNLMFVGLQQSLLLLHVCLAVVSGPSVISECAGKDIVLCCSKEILGDEKPYWFKNNSHESLDIEHDDKYMTGSNATHHKLLILNASNDDFNSEYKCQRHEGSKNFITTLLTQKNPDECKSVINCEEMCNRRNEFNNTSSNNSCNNENSTKINAILVLLAIQMLFMLGYCYHLYKDKKKPHRQASTDESNQDNIRLLADGHPIQVDAGSSIQVHDGLPEIDCDAPVVELPEDEDLGVVRFRQVPENNHRENAEIKDFKIEMDP